MKTKPVTPQAETPLQVRVRRSEAMLDNRVRFLAFKGKSVAGAYQR